MRVTGTGRALRTALASGALLALTACGTTFELPSVSDASGMEARKMFAQERAQVSRSNLTSAQAASRFRRVVNRVRPVAVRFCQSQTANDPAKVCDLPILIDDQTNARNAYYTRDAAGEPYIAFTIPLVMDSRSDDEVAFVLAHEYSHHIGSHIDKADKQAAVGALIVGIATAAGQAYATDANPSRYTGNDADVLQSNMKVGAAIGNRAYSQTYELESDVIGTYITKAAGYDPVEGAKFFARPEAAQTQTGNLSFWGTHPPDETRLATVIETSRKIDAGGSLTTKR